MLGPLGNSVVTMDIAPRVGPKVVHASLTSVPAYCTWLSEGGRVDFETGDAFGNPED